MSEKRKLNTQTLGTKLKIIEDYQNGMKNRDLAIKYKIPHNTVSNIIRNASKITNIHIVDKNRKYIRKSRYPEIENELTKYVDECRKANIDVMHKDIRDKASELAKLKGLTDFKASSGYVSKFLERCAFKKTSDESEEDEDEDNNEIFFHISELIVITFISLYIRHFDKWTFALSSFQTLNYIFHLLIFF